MALPPGPKNYLLIIGELRRSHTTYAGYTCDSIVISGLKPDDKTAIDKYLKKKNNTSPPQVDPEDGRFIVRGPVCNVMEMINVLNVERGYEITLMPQQHNVPTKSGNQDDRFALVYHMVKIEQAKPCEVDKAEKEFDKLLKKLDPEENVDDSADIGDADDAGGDE